MGADSKIQWTHHTFNPWIGCQRVSPGCEHCYAEALAKRSPGLVLGSGPHPVLPGHRLVTWGPQAPRRVTSPDYWRQPLKWDRAAEKAGERRRVFCASLADVFEDWRGEVAGGFADGEDSHGLTPQRTLDDVRATLWRLIEQTPHLDWLLLTKRPQHIMRMAPYHWNNPGVIGTTGRWPGNVWIGCTAEDQQRADERLPHLLRVPAAVRFVSYEPALGPVDWASGRWLENWDDAPEGWSHGRIDWIIVGGESGPGARPFDLAWARSTVAACQAAGVPVFVKQMGARPFVAPNLARKQGLPFGGASPCVDADGRLHLSDRKGGDMDEWPADLRVREWPR